MDALDYGLRKMSAKNKTNVKYVSFKNSTKADRITGLKLNRLLNVRLKYEWLEDFSVIGNAKYKGNKGSLGQILMSIKSKGIPLFKGVEQGLGKYDSRVYMYYKPNIEDEVKK